MINSKNQKTRQQAKKVVLFFGIGDSFPISPYHTNKVYLCCFCLIVPPECFCIPYKTNPIFIENLGCL